MRTAIVVANIIMLIIGTTGILIYLFDLYTQQPVFKFLIGLGIGFSYGSALFHWIKEILQDNY